MGSAVIQDSTGKQITNMGLAALHYPLSWVAQNRGLRMVCLSLFLTACASAPQVAEKSTSQFNDGTPPASPLVTLATSQQDSGIRLLADPSEALQSRLHLAALATSTLDIPVSYTHLRAHET